MCVLNEQDLHYAVVQAIRNHFPHFVMVVQAGELQTTSGLRSMMWKKGFTGGQPDIMITNPHIKYRGLCIEFKSPKTGGRVTDNQGSVFSRYEQMNWFVIIADDYTKLIIDLAEYNRGVREVCPMCDKLVEVESIDYHMEICIYT